MNFHNLWRTFAPHKRRNHEQSHTRRSRDRSADGTPFESFYLPHPAGADALVDVWGYICGGFLPPDPFQKHLSPSRRIPEKFGKWGFIVYRSPKHTGSGDTSYDPPADVREGNSCTHARIDVVVLCGRFDPPGSLDHMVPPGHQDQEDPYPGTLGSVPVPQSSTNGGVCRRRTPPRPSRWARSHRLGGGDLPQRQSRVFMVCCLLQRRLRTKAGSQGLDDHKNREPPPRDVVSEGKGNPQERRRGLLGKKRLRASRKNPSGSLCR